MRQPAARPGPARRRSAAPRAPPPSPRPPIELPSGSTSTWLLPLPCLSSKIEELRGIAPDDPLLVFPRESLEQLGHALLRVEADRPHMGKVGTPEDAVGAHMLDRV